MLYPALDVVGSNHEFVLAVVDDFSPLAVEEQRGIVTFFFPTPTDRERARLAVLDAFPDATATSRDVDDEDWARRSQQNLQPVTVGRITIAPPWAVVTPPGPHVQASTLEPLCLVIEPSMGFGTGHHATTRLCLAALQTIDLAGAFVLDVGTGSGILALAARRLGASAALGIDVDPDAVRSATENLGINDDVTQVDFELGDLTTRPPSSPRHSLADVVTANLTGALLVRSGHVLIDCVRVGGHLILSGLLRSEEAVVAAAFSPRTQLVSITSEDEWVGMVVRRVA